MIAKCLQRLTKSYKLLRVLAVKNAVGTSSKSQAVLAVELRGPLKELGLKVLVERQAPQHLNQRLEELLVDGLSVSFKAMMPDITDTLADFWISGMSVLGQNPGLGHINP